MTLYIIIHSVVGLHFVPTLFHLYKIVELCIAGKLLTLFA